MFSNLSIKNQKSLSGGASKIESQSIKQSVSSDFRIMFVPRASPWVKNIWRSAIFNLACSSIKEFKSAFKNGEYFFVCSFSWKTRDSRQHSEFDAKKSSF